MHCNKTPWCLQIIMQIVTKQFSEKYKQLMHEIYNWLKSIIIKISLFIYLFKLCESMKFPTYKLNYCKLNGSESMKYEPI